MDKCPTCEKAIEEINVNGNMVKQCKSCGWEDYNEPYEYGEDYFDDRDDAVI
ncbi:MAG: hypothetical protein KJ984_03815 [Nanoarchaeota archaeon]|nr:hypothetical protein [Nanoarchaeota archaeon]